MVGKKCPQKVKNQCKLCLQSVSNKNGLQCKGACKRWIHFDCLNLTPGKIQDIKNGIIQINCPCPTCNTTVPKEFLTDPPFTCQEKKCPAAQPPRCEQTKCPSNGPIPDYALPKSPCAPKPCDNVGSTCMPPPPPCAQDLPCPPAPYPPVPCPPVESCPPPTPPCFSTKPVPCPEKPAENRPDFIIEPLSFPPEAQSRYSKPNPINIPEKPTPGLAVKPLPPSALKPMYPRKKPCPMIPGNMPCNTESFCPPQHQCEPYLDSECPSGLPCPPAWHPCHSDGCATPAWEYCPSTGETYSPPGNCTVPDWGYCPPEGTCCPPQTDPYPPMSPIETNLPRTPHPSIAPGPHHTRPVSPTDLIPSPIYYSDMETSTDGYAVNYEAALDSHNTATGDNHALLGAMNNLASTMKELSNQVQNLVGKIENAENEEKVT